MLWGTVTVGGMPLREELTVAASNGQVMLTGQESHLSGNRAYVMSTHANMIALQDRWMPIVFSDKTELSGFYSVSASQSTLFSLEGSAYLTATWQATLQPIGFDIDLEFESRVPTIPRLTQLAGITPAYWHSPPVGSLTYFTGSTTPTLPITRTTADGVINVYSGIPANIAPRWTVGVADYLRGSARLLFDGNRVIGTATYPYAAWELHNGLVRLTQVGAGIGIQMWSGALGSWSAVKVWTPTVGGTALTGIPTLDVLRNEPEEVTVRLTYPQNPGRMTVDLDLRRGARFATGVVKRFSSAALGLVRDTTEAATVVTGGVRATAQDAQGVRFTAGSSRTLATATAPAAISQASTTRFDFFLGGEVIASPQTGDTFADILSQYIGTTGERVRAVRRG